MSEHRYILEPYQGIGSRYICPSCGTRKKFARYFDTVDKCQLSDKVGKCERADNCGYHYTPKQYFADNGIVKPQDIGKKNSTYAASERPASFIDRAIFERSLACYDDNHFITYLSSLFSSDLVKSLIDKYRIGTSKHWPGSTVFWQIDDDSNIRTGKVMQYNAETGKRVKEPKERIHWVHSLLKLKDYCLKQCFFGHHLIAGSNHPIAIVESEKTAIIASAYLPQFIWLASGNKQGLNNDKCMSLKGRKVVLYPDLNAFDEWENKADLYGFAISDLLERKATDEERSKGFDLADYLVRFDVSEFNQRGAINDQPEVQLPEPLNSVYEKFMSAEKDGLLSSHPESLRIKTLWDAVALYRDRPAIQELYVSQLNSINI